MHSSLIAALSSETKKPLIVPRTYRGNMCGVRVPGISSVAGGAADPELVLSWFIDRYSRTEYDKIIAAWLERGDVDTLVSWPDSRSYGYGVEDFVATCRALVQEEFLPTVFLYSKDYDPTDTGGILANCLPCLKALLAAGVAARVCIGWELSIALSPTTVQELIDAIAPLCVAAGVKCYVHFQQGYFAFQQPDHDTADFWIANVGKLTGILHQRLQSGPDAWDPPMYQARIEDCLQRFAGGFNYPSDSGFGHPFDFIALEITAMDQFGGVMSESEGDTWGTVALSTPASVGPLGSVPVMGSGNGQS